MLRKMIFLIRIRLRPKMIWQPYLKEITKKEIYCRSCKGGEKEEGETGKFEYGSSYTTTTISYNKV